MHAAIISNSESSCNDKSKSKLCRFVPFSIVVAVVCCWCSLFITGDWAKPDNITFRLVPNKWNKKKITKQNKTNYKTFSSFFVFVLSFVADLAALSISIYLLICFFVLVASVFMLYFCFSLSSRFVIHIGSNSINNNKTLSTFCTLCFHHRRRRCRIQQILIRLNLV